MTVDDDDDARKATAAEALLQWGKSKGKTTQQQLPTETQDDLDANAKSTASPSTPPPQPVNASTMFSMTSIGFGIDNSAKASLGDATDAALKAIQDAMERSILRLPVSSSAQDQLQIKVKLGVPSRRDASNEPMKIDVARLSTSLPSVAPIFSSQLGGLYLPSE